jgi:hypothetical protein
VTALPKNPLTSFTEYRFHNIFPIFHYCHHRPMPDICFMKTSLFKLSTVPLLVLGFSLSFTQCTDLAGLDENPDAGEQLSAMERSGILFMREEEKLARDVYLYLYEIYPLRPFLNISKSEQAHMDAMLYLIDTLNLVDPVGKNPPGVFQNEELQELYDVEYKPVLLDSDQFTEIIED